MLKKSYRFLGYSGGRGSIAIHVHEALKNLFFKLETKY